MNFICNIIESPPDERDFIFSSENMEIPEVLDYRPDLHPVRNQGSQGTCYAQSAACAKEWQEKKDYGFNEYFSPQFFYDNRSNKYDDKTNNDAGMFGRDVMKLLKNVGICREQVYPYGSIKHRENIPLEIYKEAECHTIKSYARINDLDNLKKSLFKNGPCLIAFPTFNYTSEFWRERPGDSRKGGHAVTVVGYNKDGFIIRNSWGKSWADNGYTIYPYSQWGSHWEIWTTIDKESDIPLDDEPKDNDDISDKNRYRCCVIV